MANRETPFYTYMWLREDGTPYYIGKGKGKRGYKTDDHGVKRPASVERIITQDFLSEADAFAAEIFLIEYFGRKNLGTGCLRNLTNGGEGVSGIRWSTAQKQKLSDSHKGLFRTEQHRENLSLSHRGVKLSPTHRAALIGSHTNRGTDSLWAQRQREAHKGKPWSKARREAQARRAS